MNQTPSEFQLEARQPHLHPRAVPWQHALAWYEDAMRLFKRAPAKWVTLAILTVATELVLKLVPGVGTLLSQLVTPLVACGLVYAAGAADRGSKPTTSYVWLDARRVIAAVIASAVRDAIRAFRAPPEAIAAVIASALVAFLAEAFAAWWIADVNLFDNAAGSTDLSLAAVAGILALGILASLPVMFVVFHVLLENVRPAPAFTASWNAFMLNTLPLLVYSAASMVLLGFGLVTFGLGLALALPLWAASSYAAWKDIFGIRDAPD